MSLLKKKEKPAKAAGVAKAAKKGSVLANARLYDVIQRPLVTEKTTAAAEQNKVVFKISPTATKNDVKAAVESIFNVTVLKVNTINVEGKVKRFGGRTGQRSDFRKAIVTLASGQTIDFAAGAR
ncbi:MAG: 50S ribosomal protein L23 [Alphaproteobacteria bacterium]|nr:50S ribosomal protein L23 [Alphaproteobacteria bacterium]